MDKSQHAIALAGMALYRREFAETRKLIQVKATREFAEQMRAQFFKARQVAINLRIAPWLYE